MKTILILVCSICFGISSHGQSEDYSIMVVPFKKMDENYHDIFENNRFQRFLAAKLDEILLLNGFETLDFVQQYRNYKKDLQLANNKGVSDNIENKIARELGADIILYVDGKYVRNSGNVRNYANVIVKVIDVQTSKNLVSANANSLDFDFDDIELIIGNAIGILAENLIADIKFQFDKLKDQGKSLRIRIGVNANSDIDLYNEDSEFNLLSEKLEEHIESIAKSSYARCPISSSSLLDCTDVRVEYDEEPRRLHSKIRKFIRAQGLYLDHYFIGSSLYFNICGSQPCNTNCGEGLGKAQAMSSAFKVKEALKYINSTYDQSSDCYQDAMTVASGIIKEHQDVICQSIIRDVNLEITRNNISGAIQILQNNPLLYVCQGDYQNALNQMTLTAGENAQLLEKINAQASKIENLKERPISTSLISWLGRLVF